ncbi:hypothetical protein Hsero_1615 [Herbaspirillum seropedicae SmR1]|uniref:Uncharacterized protein n=1 Tax=Herbaspirillum seropedicae (strain SmR1) TaxID=757424 RepID=D8IQ82_HERSS|nr:hypothetical protein Hsero_1615 [Herbaspirillum seropedicae SmR1]
MHCTQLRQQAAARAGWAVAGHGRSFLTGMTLAVLLVRIKSFFAQGRGSGETSLSRNIG